MGDESVSGETKTQETQGRRIHQVSCALISHGEPSATFDEAARRAEKVERYARRLGFAVVSDNVDRGEDADEVSDALLAAVPSDASGGGS